MEAARRQEEGAVEFGLQVGLQMLRSTDPDVTLLNAWNTSHPIPLAVLPPIGVVILRIKVSELPRISPYLSAARGTKGFRLRRRDETVTPAREGPGRVWTRSCTCLLLSSTKGGRSLNDQHANGLRLWIRLWGLPARGCLLKTNLNLVEVQNLASPHFVSCS
jgi:hypothetical protein